MANYSEISFYAVVIVCYMAFMSVWVYALIRAKPKTMRHLLKERAPYESGEDSSSGASRESTHALV